MNVKELSYYQTKSFDGGWSLIPPVMVYADVVVAGLKSFIGAYQKGYDQAQNNCECEQ